MSKLAVIGAGAWGTALTLHASRAGHEVTLVARDAGAVAAIEARRESNRLPGHPSPGRGLVTRRNVPGGADLLLWAVPTQHLRTSLLRLCPDTGAIVVCAKGVEAGTHLLPLEVASDASSERPLAVLTGPNFAQEVAMGLPAAAVVASTDARLRERVLAALGTNTFRLYSNDDPIGAQLGGAAKNVIAIAAGAVMGAGLGENARAALVTRGLSELCRLAIALGGRARNGHGIIRPGRSPADLHRAFKPEFQPGPRAGPRGKPAQHSRQALNGNRGCFDSGRACCPCGRRRTADLSRGDGPAGRGKDIGSGDQTASVTPATR